MMAAGPGDEVTRVARALVARGSVREGIAMLRGAIVRDAQEQSCQELLTEVLETGTATPQSGFVELDLALVDRWVRAGKLVEALALLSGTSMGTLDTGREWATLLGELLAPVPADADEKLVRMHEELLSGGASLALGLLEERAKEPNIPAWAARRLEVIRWMLLDNASIAVREPILPGAIPSELGDAIRGALDQRNLAGALEAAVALLEKHGENPDAPRTVAALEAIVAEVSYQADRASNQHRTIPIFGRPAAAMQLRMCNFLNAAAVYERLLAETPEDEVRVLSEHVDAVLRALAGLPVGDRKDAGWEDESTTLTSSQDGIDLPTLETKIDGALGPDTDVPPAPEKSGPVAVTKMSKPPVDMGATEEIPNAEQGVDRLIAEGQLAEAEAVLRGFARLFPHQLEHLRRADELRDRRLADIDVVVREIRSVK